MTSSTARPALGVVVYTALAFAFGMYFTFASVQGDYGLFKRVQIDAEADQLRAQLADLQAQVEVMRNKTTRLSDKYLDLDLLDEQVRDVLGMVRSDEVVLR